MDDQSLELFNIISILKKVTKKQERLEDIKNLETEIIDLNFSGNNYYKISLRICKIWKYFKISKKLFFKKIIYFCR